MCEFHVHVLYLFLGVAGLFLRRGVGKVEGWTHVQKRKVLMKIWLGIWNEQLKSTKELF
jgi:hypothetical protein